MRRLGADNLSSTVIELLQHKTLPSQQMCWSDTYDYMSAFNQDRHIKLCRYARHVNHSDERYGYRPMILR